MTGLPGFDDHLDNYGDPGGSMLNRKPLAERIAEDNITLTYRHGRRDSFGDDGWQGDHYTVTLKHDDRHIFVGFSKGYGHKGEPPTVEEVLECLLSDASGIENSNGFEDWCGEYGYDTDSRKAERIYKATARANVKLAHLLGDKYDAYVWETETDV